MAFTAIMLLQLLLSSIAVLVQKTKGVPNQDGKKWAQVS